jgi:LmbE family N-acetylglucosaminyl deacetylase
MEPERKIILAIQAHPDDVDFSSGGTVAKFVQQGHEVHYLSVTSGPVCRGVQGAPPQLASQAKKHERW